jgi:hypothetical protein
MSNDQFSKVLRLMTELKSSGESNNVLILEALQMITDLTVRVDSLNSTVRNTEAIQKTIEKLGTKKLKTRSFDMSINTYFNREWANDDKKLCKQMCISAEAINTAKKNLKQKDMKNEKTQSRALCIAVYRSLTDKDKTRLKELRNAAKLKAEREEKINNKIANPSETKTKAKSKSKAKPKKKVASKIKSKKGKKNVAANSDSDSEHMSDTDYVSDTEQSDKADINSDTESESESESDSDSESDSESDNSGSDSELESETPPKTKKKKIIKMPTKSKSKPFGRKRKV